MRNPSTRVLKLAVAMLVTGTAACVNSSDENPPDDTTATSDVEDNSSRASSTLRDAAGQVVAQVSFARVSGGTQVTVSARRAGFHGIHGFHAHANDNPANGDGCIADPAQPNTTHFFSVDGHFNPDGTTHGDHAGDMPALFFTEAGVAAMSFLLDSFTPANLRGRAMIIHQGADNYGNIPVGTAPTQYTPNSAEATTLTQNTGNAGVRVACGVIR
jgi:superoxide dismutase, Cu-Zn family